MKIDLSPENLRKNHMTLLVIIAIVIIVAILAVFTVFGLGHKKEEKNSADDAEVIAQDVDFGVYDENTEYAEGETYTSSEWPLTDFPDIPVFEADSYDIVSLDGNISVVTSADYYADLEAYIETLRQKGAETCVEDEYFCILSYEDVEIQIYKDTASPRICFAFESEVDVPDSFDAYPLPEGGRVVEAVTEEDSTDTLYLTVRCLTYEEVQQYCLDLLDYGWNQISAPPTSETPEVFMAEYNYEGQDIIVDFHTGSADMKIIFGYNEDNAPKG